MSTSEGIGNNNSDIAVENSNAQEGQVDPNHPLYIYPSDTQGAVLISTQLVGSENYSLWSKSMRIVLLGKNKLGFLLGTCKKESFPSNLHNLWERCNAIVLAWIMNTVSKNLLSSVIYGSDAHKVWEDLRERFDEVNVSRAFYLHREIASLSQGTSSVSIYYYRLRELWDELDTLMPPSCSCPESRTHSQHSHLQKLWQFLMGLNESYTHARSQVLMAIPLPSINQAYAIILNVESQRTNGANSTEGNLDPTTLLSSRGHPTFSGGTSNRYQTHSRGSRGGYQNNIPGYNGTNYKPRVSFVEQRNNYGKSNLYCDYCHWKGHTREICYKLHGYPNGKKKNGNSQNHASNVTTSGVNHVESQTHRGPTTSAPPPPPTSTSDTTMSASQLFTPEQYNQILYMLKGKGSETIANAATTPSSSGTLQWTGSGNW